jgi:hypothetical protein
MDVISVNSSVAEYLSRMQGTPLPLSLHHFLKFSADTIKREADIESSPLSSQDMGGLLEIAADPHELLIENGEGGVSYLYYMPIISSDPKASCTISNQCKFSEVCYIVSLLYSGDDVPL